jgi:hypothetical protein
MVPSSQVFVNMEIRSKYIHYTLTYFFKLLNNRTIHAIYGDPETLARSRASIITQNE